MIGARISSNGWLLAELFLVFIVMWFLCDSLGSMKYTFYQPLGYNIDHVYLLDVSTGGESHDSTFTETAKKVELVHRLQRVPGIEAVGLSLGSLPLSGTNMVLSYSITDSVGVSVRNVLANEGYMKVFRFGYEDAAHTIESMRPGANEVMLSKGAFDEAKELYPAFSLDTRLDRGEKKYEWVQKGVVSGFRSYRYGRKASWGFIRIDDKIILEEGENSGMPIDITFRVKPEADNADFRQHFLDKIAPTLDVDNLFVVVAVPYTSLRDRYEVMRGDTDRVNTHTVIILFLLANVFLGLVGIFWFRTRRRRSEIALRLSVGSSRQQIFGLLIGEGLLLLTLVTIPAAVVCYSVALGEPTLGNSPLISTNVCLLYTSPSPRDA